MEDKKYKIIEDLKKYYPTLEEEKKKEAPYIEKILKILAEDKNLTINEANTILHICSELLTEATLLI